MTRAWRKATGSEASRESASTIDARVVFEEGHGPSQWQRASTGDPNALPMNPRRTIAFQRDGLRLAPLEAALLERFKAALVPTVTAAVDPETPPSLKGQLRHAFWAKAAEAVQQLAPVELSAVVATAVERERAELQETKRGYLELRQKAIDLHAEYHRWLQADAATRRLNVVAEAFRATLADHNPYVRKNAAYGMGLAMAAALGMTIAAPPSPLPSTAAAEFTDEAGR